MELKDTISNMTSISYEDRFIAEYQQLKIRYEKLKTFCNKIEASEITNSVGSVVHDCPLDLLRKQQKTMGEYLHILEIRAIIERIELNVNE